MVTQAVALGVTAVALATFAALGTWYSRGRVGSAEDYISARDSAGTGRLTATLVASSMGAWILLSPAEAAAAFGGISALVGYGLGSATPLVVYAWLGPRIRRYIPDGHSLTEYAYARYGTGMYAYVLVVSVAYMFIFLAAEMTGITGALSLVAGVPLWQTALLIGGFVLAYTAYGGLQASIFTDTLQTLVLLPLLAVGFAAAILSLGGAGSVHETVVATDPSLLNPGFVPGLKFGAYVVVAVLGAEMLNQAWWQRIYAGRDDAAVRRSFLVAAVAVVPMVVTAGLFGLAATGLDSLVTSGAGYNADVAFFLVVNASFPEWITLAVVVIAVLLVMSTADTLFNAIASVATADLKRLLSDPDDGTLRLAGRTLTVVVALAATVVGAQGYSVLQIFFTADLLATATFVPLLYGLYSARPSGPDMLLSSVVGLAVGVALFPPAAGLLADLGVAGSLPAPSFFRSFLSAALVSGLLALVTARFGDADFDLDALDAQVRRLDEPVADGGTVETDSGVDREVSE
ncbi:MAG: sodium:proline symporter [Haloarculaceae archaeon]